MTYQNVDVPEVRKKFGGGYVGANLYSQGVALAQEALRLFNLKKGDRVIVFGNWGMPGRYIREQGSADAFEKAGLIVDKLTITVEQINSPELLLPVITGAMLAHPETKLILYSNSTNLGTVPLYMETLNKKPGEILNIGFEGSLLSTCKAPSDMKLIIKCRHWRRSRMAGLRSSSKMTSSIVRSHDMPLVILTSSRLRSSTETITISLSRKFDESSTHKSPDATGDDVLRITHCSSLSFLSRIAAGQKSREEL